MKYTLFPLLLLALSGCLDSRRSYPTSGVPSIRSASLFDFVGDYQNLAVGQESRSQTPLSEILIGYFSPTMKKVETVTLSMGGDQTLIVSCIKGGEEILRKEFGKQDYSFQNGVITLGAGSYSPDGASGVVGKQRYSRIFYLDSDLSLVFRAQESFRGVAYGFVPAATSTDVVSIWRRK